MKTSSVLLSLSLGTTALVGLTNRNTLQPPNSANGTTPQAKRYIVEFEPVSVQRPVLGETIPESHADHR